MQLSKSVIYFMEQGLVDFTFCFQSWRLLTEQPSKCDLQVKRRLAVCLNVILMVFDDYSYNMKFYRSYDTQDPDIFLCKSG